MQTKAWVATKGEMISEATGFHAHKEHQILVAVEGLMLFEDASHRHVLSRANAAWIPAGCEHQGSTLGRRVSFLSLYFSQALYEQMAGDAQEALPQELVVFGVEPLWMRALERLCQVEPQTQQDPIEEATLRLVMLLFSERLRAKQPLILPRGRTMEAVALLLWLEQRFRHPVTLADLAAHLHLSERSVQRIFSRDVGMGFGAYLTLRRVFEAALLLSTTQHTILEVALEVGYESLGSFYGAFQKILGMTPKAYQKQSFVDLRAHTPQ